MDRGYSTHGRRLVGEPLQGEDQPVLTQIKKAYWTTKQQVIKKFGKKQDEHIVASDAELDAKLELYKQIKLSCIELLRAILLYQKRLIVLAREENSMGKFLKSHGDEDSTQAGKMMRAVGRSQGFTAHQRVQLRQPLYRLFQEVDTFRQQAIADTQITVTKMEEARTAYRAALLWMKDVSEQLDPDAYNRLEKFRMVQTQVRKSKEVFDKYKLDVMQKVDLLAASRSNMFSHALLAYQTSILSFWKKTSKTMNAVSETFKGFQYYEFNMLKNDLDEATKELARQTTSEKAAELVESLLADVGHDPQTEEDKLIYDIIMSLKEKESKSEDENAQDKESSEKKKTRRQMEREESADSTSGLIDFAEDEDAFIDDDVSEQFGEFQAAMDKETQDFELLGDDQVTDKYAAFKEDPAGLLNDIFGSDNSGLMDDLSGLVLGSSEAYGGSGDGFLPSDLLDSETPSLPLQMPEQISEQRPPPPAYTPSIASGTTSKLPEKSKSKSSQPMSSWYNLFADLDPLQDPDAIGKKNPDKAGCA